MYDLITAVASLLTFVVIAVSAIAALVQLRHLRASNQIEAILAIEEEFRDPHLQRALRYVQNDLAAKLEDPRYRTELAARGFIQGETHPEVLLCNWFNKIGALLKHGLVTEGTFMDLFGRLIVYYWDALAPAIAVIRRDRGDVQYYDFEYLARRARQWSERYPAGATPAGYVREPLRDPWQTADSAPPPG